MDKAQIELQARNLCRAYIDKGFTEITFHTYRDPSGKILYWRIRMVNPTTGEKVIRPMSVQSGVFVLSEPVFEDQKPLYGLDRLMESNTVFFVEGELCVDTLHSLGLIATTSGGSSSFPSADLEPLRNKSVYLWADNDDPGIKFMESVASHLDNIGCQVKMLDIKALNLPKGGDVVDWLKANPNATSQTVLSMAYWQNLSGAEVTSSAEWIWEDPTPILEDFQHEPYPKEYLPQIIKDAVDEVAAFVQSPYSMLASSAISAISLACQALFDVQRSDKLKGPCSSYFLTIAESGERKSTGEGFFTESIREYERNQADIAKPYIKEFKAKFVFFES
jgi:5S rRNA maturation endonuclease (ribonuclease M5)